MRPPSPAPPAAPEVPPTGPLAGVRVVEMGQLVAGPFAATVLAYFGAEVIKIEPPGAGDPIRGWRMLDGGTSLWWRSLGRNKRCVTIDLRQADGRDLARRLLVKADVAIENFRPGTLERWGLGPEDLRPVNPDLIWARVSGYGQDGPSAGLPGYASVCEAVGGFRFLNGLPGETPVRPNLSLGDTLAGLHAALGIVIALYARRAGTAKVGQVVDVSIVESVFNVLEAVVPEYDRFGAVRGPSGSTITGVVPTGTYPTRDGRQVVIGANGDSNYRRLMFAAGRADLADAPDLASNAGRVARQAEIDGAIADWTRALDGAEVLAALAAAEVPAGFIYSVADMFADPHFHARGLFETVATANGPLRVPAVLPRLTATPGATRWAGREVGADTRAVLMEELGLDEAAIADLARRGVLQDDLQDLRGRTDATGEPQDPH